MRKIGKWALRVFSLITLFLVGVTFAGLAVMCVYLLYMQASTAGLHESVKVVWRFVWMMGAVFGGGGVVVVCTSVIADWREERRWNRMKKAVKGE